MFLDFYSTDVGFEANLRAVREARLKAREFGVVFFVVFFGGRKSMRTRSACVKGDSKTFECDGLRVPLEEVKMVQVKI